MGFELAPFLDGLFTRSKGIQSIYNLISTRLTPQRGAGLDNVANLSGGPVALQQYLGRPTDIAADTTTLFAMLQNVEACVLTLQSEVGAAGNSPMTRNTLTPNTVNNVNNLFIGESVSVTGNSSASLSASTFVLNVAGGNTISVRAAANGEFTWDLTQESSLCSTMNWSLSRIPLWQIPPSFIPPLYFAIGNTGSVTTYTVPVPSIAASGATGIYVRTNGVAPSATGDVWLWSLGYHLVSAPWIGVRRRAGLYYFSAWNHTDPGPYELLLSGTPATWYPQAVTYTAANGATLTTADGQTLHIPAAQCPPASAMLPQRIERNSGLVMFDAGYW